MKTTLYLTEAENGSLQPTAAGRKVLDELVTDVEGPVYAFRSGVNPVIPAAAMARLSRRGSDLREIILDEFVGDDSDSKLDGLVRRVVSEYGDDSVQQLVGVHLVVEDASNLLTKWLEWGRLASYLEQSTRYIFFDQKDAFGRFKYLTPADFPEELKIAYEAAMNGMFVRYSTLVHQLTAYVRENNPQGDDQRGVWLASTRAQACDAARALLPAATKSTVGIYGSAQAIDNMIMNLMSLEMDEAREAGLAIYEQVSQVVPVFLERTLLPDRGLGTVAYRSETRSAVEGVARAILKNSDSYPMEAEKSPVRLLDYFPHDERELAAEMLFQHSDLRMEEINRQLQYLPQKVKEDTIRTYIGERLNRRHKPGRALEKAHYEWEILGDYGSFRDLQRHRIVDAFEWQRLTVQHGYEVPDLVRRAGLEEQFNAGFTQSAELFQLVEQAGFPREAQYATLMGHRMRYRFITNARELYHLLELRTSPQGHPGYRLIAQQMYELLGKVHPIVAGGMRFVNQSDMDGELTRLASERATAYRLEKLVSAE